MAESVSFGERQAKTKNHLSCVSFPYFVFFLGAGGILRNHKGAGLVAQGNWGASGAENDEVILVALARRS